MLHFAIPAEEGRRRGVGGQARVIFEGGMPLEYLPRCDFDEAGLFVEEPIFASRCAPISVSCCEMKGNF